MGDAVKPILALGGRAKHVAQTAQKFSAIAFTAFGHREPLVGRLRISYKRFAAQKGMQIVNRALWRGLYRQRGEICAIFGRLIAGLVCQTPQDRRDGATLEQRPPPKRPDQRAAL